MSAYTVKQLLKKNKFKKRKARESQSLGTCLFRDEQFENIATLRKEFSAAGLPIISIDTKKKEVMVHKRSEVALHIVFDQYSEFISHFG